MDKKLIDEYIEELENCDTTYNNIRDLAALYVVKEKIHNSVSSVEKELSDILPAYNLYINNKRQYQLRQLNKDSLLAKMGLLCSEIEEFLLVLYQNTECEEERSALKTQLQTILKKFQENT